MGNTAVYNVGVTVFIVERMALKSPRLDVSGAILLDRAQIRDNLLVRQALLL